MNAGRREGSLTGSARRRAFLGASAPGVADQRPKRREASPRKTATHKSRGGSSTAITSSAHVPGAHRAAPFAPASQAQALGPDDRSEIDCAAMASSPALFSWSRVPPLLAACALFAGLLGCKAKQSTHPEDATAADGPSELPAQAEGPRQPENGTQACPAGKKAGDQWKVDCNTCTCTKDGKVHCTLIGCLDQPAPANS